MKQTGGVLIVFAGFVALVMGLNGTMGNVWKALWNQQGNGSVAPTNSVTGAPPTLPSDRSIIQTPGIINETTNPSFQNVPGSGVRQP